MLAQYKYNTQFRRSCQPKTRPSSQQQTSSAQGPRRQIDLQCVFFASIIPNKRRLLFGLAGILLPLSTSRTLITATRHPWLASSTCKVVSCPCRRLFAIIAFVLTHRQRRRQEKEESLHLLLLSEQSHLSHLFRSRYVGAATPAPPCLALPCPALPSFHFTLLAASNLGPLVACSPAARYNLSLLHTRCHPQTKPNCTPDQFDRT